MTLALTALVSALALAGGCSPSDSVAALKLQPVKGTVLQADGKPLTTGRVAFVLPEKGYEFSGDLQSDGSYTLGSGESPGAVEGTYKVRIDPDPSKSSPGKGKSTKRASLPYPEKYADETTSGLTATVRAGANTIEPFKLVPGGSTASPGKGDRHLGRRD